MFRFEHIEHLYALVGIPVLVIIFALLMVLRKRALGKLGTAYNVSRLMPGKSKYRHYIKFGLLVFAFALLCIAWANPQRGAKKEKVKRKSADIIIALDVSESMLAQDLRPNRMERAKLFMTKLIDGLKGERLGVIVFAGNAYLQMPLTTDYSAVELFIKSANTKIVPRQGTAIGDAIELAQETFEGDNKYHKALIVVTDGENHEPKAIEMAEEAKEQGILIYTIGVGTPNGGNIPIGGYGRTEYKKDRAGNIVVSKLNELTLQRISEITRGKYYNIADSDKIIPSLQGHIEKLEKQEFEQRSFTEYESYFQYFLAIALLLLIVEFLLAYRTSNWLKKRDIFKI